MPLQYYLFYDCTLYFITYDLKVVSVQLADNDMDNYVLAVAKKKTAVKMMKELTDIVSI